MLQKPANFKRRLMVTVIVTIGISLIIPVYFYFKPGSNPINDPRWGQPVDSFNHVLVYYNGSVSNTNGRNLSPDGYNIGLKYQCVEFVKRYYYEYLHHKMPDSYGNAKDFYNSAIADGTLNTKRGLLQFTNPSASKPAVSDLVVFDATTFNAYGHVAIVCEVTDNSITIIQQNPGVTAPSRVNLDLVFENNKWKIKNDRLLGWLRKE